MNTPEPEVPAEVVIRKPGQEIGNTGQQFINHEHVGHRADADAYTRSKNKVYARKIAAQKKAKGK